MSNDSGWNSDTASEFFSQEYRTVEKLCPPLLNHLSPEATVLDVGCSSGQFTRSVATFLPSGSIIGVDPANTAIDAARQAVASAGLTNVQFQTGDAYDLEFDDNTFDLVYSLNVFVWLQDPVAALREKVRVTKPGGTVAVQMADYGNIIFYPPCPSAEQIIASLPQLREQSEPNAYIDSHQARRALEIMSHVDLHEIQIEGWAKAFPSNSEDFERSYQTWRNVFLDPDGPLEVLVGKLIDIGAVDNVTFATAQQEIDAWHEHPHALYLQTPYLVTGRVA